MDPRLRFIAVPLDEDAQKRSDYNQSIESDEIIAYLNEKDFDYLYLHTNFFTEINSVTGSLIGDYEDDEVIGEQNLERMLEVIDDHTYLKDNSVVLTLKSLTEAALLFETGVYFYF